MIYLTAGLVIIILAAYGSAPYFLVKSQPTVKNVILIVGDGMGDAEITAGRLTYGGTGKLNMDSISWTGQMTTHSANAVVTDSAASATAMATGRKTINGAVGVDGDGKPMETILEQAKRNGKLTGLVTTAHITGATPAAFASHVKDRNDRALIAEQMIGLGVDVLLGGGENDFIQKTQNGTYAAAGTRDDGRDLIKEGIAAGYVYVWDRTSHVTIDTSKTSKVLGLFTDDEMYVRAEEPEGHFLPGPSLAEMTSSAIAILSKGEKGFFLLVEQEAIDDFAHANNAEMTIEALKQLDYAVKVILDFARSRGDTLIIITGDHATGGMSIVRPDPKTGECNPDNGAPRDGPFITKDDKKFCIGWSTSYHDGQQVRVAAEGPFAEEVRGLIDNTDIYRIMSKAIGVRAG